MGKPNDFWDELGKSRYWVEYVAQRLREAGVCVAFTCKRVSEDDDIDIGLCVGDTLEVKTKNHIWNNDPSSFPFRTAAGLAVNSWTKKIKHNTVPKFIPIVSTITKAIVCIPQDTINEWDKEIIPDRREGRGYTTLVWTCPKRLLISFDDMVKILKAAGMPAGRLAAYY